MSADTLSDALNDLDDLLAGLPAAEIERRRSMQVLKQQQAAPAPAPAEAPKKEQPKEAPAPAPEVKKDEPKAEVAKDEPKAEGKPGPAIFGSDFLFSLQTGMAREEVQDAPEAMRPLSPRSLLRSFTFGGDENAELERVVAETKPPRASYMITGDAAAATTAAMNAAAIAAEAKKEEPKAPEAAPAPTPAPAPAVAPAPVSSIQTTSSRQTISRPEPTSPAAAPIAPAEPEARERLATMRQTMSAALVGLDAALQGLTVKGPASPKPTPTPAPASASQAPVRPEMRSASPTHGDVRSKVDDEMRKIEETARAKFEEDKRKREEERRKETAAAAEVASPGRKEPGAGTDQELHALRSRVATHQANQPQTSPELVRYDSASDYKRQMLEKYELEQLEMNELLRKKKEGMQLQLSSKFSILKKIKIEPEETFMCLCHHEGKIIAGTREGSLVVIDCKSQEVVEHKQKVHTGMVNVITSVGSIHLWSASDDGCINVWERKTRSAAGARDRQAQKEQGYKPCEGTLTKQGFKVKNWKVRWFVLEEESMHYYEKKDDKVPKGSINLVGAKLEKLAVKDKKYHFSITPAKGGRTYFIFASSEDERENWITHISAAIKATEEPLFVSAMSKKMKFGIVSLVPLGNSVAIGCKEPVIHFWDANTYAREELKLNLGDFKTVNPMVSKLIKYRANKATLSPRGVKDPSQHPWILWAVIDNAIVRIDVQKRTQIDMLKMEHERNITDLCETALGQIASISRDKLVMWEPETGKPMREFDIEMPLVYTLMPVGPNVWVAGFNKEDKEVIRVYDSAWKLVKELNADPVYHTGTITSLNVVVQEVGMVVWSASKDSVLCMWS